MNTALGATILVTTLLIFLFIGLVVLLLVVSRNRRNRHRAELAEIRVHHAEETRKVEREVIGQTLSEVGYELHDNLGQLLTNTRQGLKHLTNNGPDEARLKAVSELVHTITEEVRRLSRSLNVDRVGKQALADLLARECERVQRVAEVEVALTVEGEEPPLTADQKLILFRVFQEALNNAIKHAEPTRIEVSLVSSDAARLHVRDHGKGFAVQPVMESGTGQGLKNMHRRAAIIGYRCLISSVVGEGTTVVLEP